MKKIIKVLSIILIIFSLMIANVFAEESEENYIENNKQEEIEDKKNIEDLKKEKEDLVTQNEEMNFHLEFVSEELSSTVAEVAELTQNIYYKQTEMEELTLKTDILESRIKKVEKQLKDANKEYKSQKELLEKRLVAMYEMGETSYLDLLLSSKGISNFLSNYYYISEIAKTDTELLNIVSEQKKNIETMMKNLENYYLELSEAKSNSEKATIAIANMVIIKNQRVEALSDEEAKAQKEIEEYQDEIQKIESEIRILSLSSDKKTYVGGTMESTNGSSICCC